MAPDIAQQCPGCCQSSLDIVCVKGPGWTFDSDFGYDFDGALLFTMGPLCRFAFIYLEGHFKAQLCCRCYF
jgi:hypothetical protein